MTRDEAKNIVGIIKSIYPNWKIDNPTLTVDAWAIVLEDADYNAVQYAVKRYSMTDRSGFPPSIGQLMSQIQDSMDNGGLSGQEAWALVLRAIRNSSYHSQEEFARLPKAVQRAVGSAEVLKSWAMEDVDATTVLQSNFLRIYGAVAERERREAMLPQSMRIGTEERKMLDG